MTLPLGWSNHLLATHSAITDGLARVHRLAVDGQSLGGSGTQPMTPLPEEQWRVLQQGLEAIRYEIEALVETLVPEETAQEKVMRPIEVTRRQILLALAMLEEEQVDDIDPTKANHYGALDTDDQQQLEAATARMRSIIQRLRSQLSSAS